MIDSAFLLPHEIVQLTGYEADKPGRQISWLRKHGIHIYKINSKGQPVIRRIDVEGRGKAHNIQPNFERAT